MLIKSADDRAADVERLRLLANRADVTPDVRDRIEREIRNILAGERAETAAAYQLDFYFRDRPNWAVIHDLRVECGDRTAQIDHVLISRVLEFYVCESKSIADGVSVNERGEFTTFYQGRPRGIPSPSEQNQRHIAVLQALFKSGQVPLPRRLGLPIAPEFISLILVSPSARITRPKGSEFDSIIKSDQVASRVQADVERDSNALKLAKLVSSDTLRDLAERLAAQHRPIRIDWPARFGLPASQPAVPSPSVRPDTPPDAPRSRLACTACGRIVSYAVAKFCWVNKPAFGGNVYCMECQPRNRKST